MKKLLFTLAAILMASTAFAGHWVTFEAEEFEYTSGDFFVVKDGVTLEGYGRIDYDHFRFYANNTLSLSSDDGIMKIEFTCVGEDYGQYGPGNLDYIKESQRGNYTYEGYIGYWEDGLFSATDFTFVPFEEDDYNVEEGGLDPMQTIEFEADYQVRCTKISVYVLGDAPVDPSQKTGAPTFHGYTEDGIYAYFVEINETEPSTIYYRVIYPDGTVSEWAEYTEMLSFNSEGKYRVEAYAVAPGKLPSDEIAYEFVLSKPTGVLEVVSGKQVAGVRYYNMAGQEMTEANGLTIVVTTYTDGTTSAVKVMK